MTAVRELLKLRSLRAGARREKPSLWQILFGKKYTSKKNQRSGFINFFGLI